MLLILASSSISRFNLINRTGYTPDYTISPNIDETPFKNELPHKVAIRLAQKKAETVYNIIMNCNKENNKESNNENIKEILVNIEKYNKKLVVLAADTVCAVGRLILPKALNETDARFCLNKISGRRHKIHTGVCFIGINPSGKYQVINRISTTTLLIKQISTKEKDDYIKSKEWMNTAGGYKIEGMISCFVKMISGSENSNISGLPLSIIYPILNYFNSN
ncbi:Maf family protein [Lyticum sinuosum]|uniref:Nucleoside triphosphate pyrophosphatase n=1 Tax=Lyticum sinuosum TaxID=1332059 RepID=A0AAE4VK60_9RICK|nr:Maf family protein [Lyticum sinuosum]MDZ5761015.1 Maf-like protein [Lyticum sinuosum]